MILLLMIIANLIVDELQIDRKMIDDAIYAAADSLKEITYQTLIVGILAKHILHKATVLGFSRSGDYIKREFLDNRCEVYSIRRLLSDDIRSMIGQAVENEELRKSILEQMSKITWNFKNQIFFLKLIVKLSLSQRLNNQLSRLSSPSDLFLLIILGNLHYQNSSMETAFTDKDLPPEFIEYLRNVFLLCKENIKIHNEDEDDDQEDEDDHDLNILKGTQNGENWKPKSNLIGGVPLKFLKALGVFDIPLPNCGEVNLTAYHLSFIEFFAAAGVLMSSDSSNVETELWQIREIDRFKAVSIYIR